MESTNILTDILLKVPHQAPFRFIDEITRLDENGIEGNYFLDEGLEFYKGHYPGFPITPGVILTEIMAQIGMVAFGIYLLLLEGESCVANMQALLTDTKVKFRKQVFPGQRVFVVSEKVFFRHGRLQCEIQLKNGDNEILCQGSMSGMLFIKP